MSLAVVTAAGGVGLRNLLVFPLQGLVSQVLSLEEKVMQLRQKLNREELSVEVRGYRKAKMEPGVSGPERCTVCGQ